MCLPFKHNRSDGKLFLFAKKGKKHKQINERSRVDLMPKRSTFCLLLCSENFLQVLLLITSSARKIFTRAAANKSTDSSQRRDGGREKRVTKSHESILCAFDSEMHSASFFHTAPAALSLTPAEHKREMSKNKPKNLQTRNYSRLGAREGKNRTGKVY
jgi:hypothetical protein